MGKAALLFPGQGAQVVGMGRDVADACPRAKAVFDNANKILGFDLARICFEGPAQKLEQTDIQQPAIFTVSVAIWEAMLDAGAQISDFGYAAGLSLGEYTALHVAGAMSFEDGLRLVRRRGELMQAAALANPSGMVSLIGADKQSATLLCARASEGEVLTPANFNCPGQVVISGTKAACERAVALAGEVGLRAIELPVAGAFHSALMEPAAISLREVLDKTKLTTPKFKVTANVNTSFHSEPEAIRDLLRKQVTNPVLWQGCVEQMVSDGVDRFVEVGPGRVLTGLMRKIDRQINIVNVSSAAAVSAVLTTSAG